MSLLPVVVFLVGLELIDSFKLLRLRRVLETVAAGCLAGLLCYAANTLGAAAIGVPRDAWARCGAPPLEEVVKAAYVVWLVRSGRVGFMVDAAISGFAVGAGFALVENLWYLPSIAGAGLAPAAVRGLGTAIMHGGTTAIFGLLSMNRAEAGGARRWRAFLPGLAVAIAIHGLYNQGFLSPAISAAVLLVLVPVLLAWIFTRSEEALEKWVGTQLDNDMDLLRMIATGTFTQSRAGAYLRSLESAFLPVVLGDMLAYLQLSLELSAQVKGDLLRREMGFPAEPDPELPARLKEMAYLEKQMGRAGKLALQPLLGSSRRDVWELYQLKGR